MSRTRNGAQRESSQAIADSFLPDVVSRKYSGLFIRSNSRYSFEERAKYIEATINRLRQPTTFEEFAARSVLPAALPSDVVPRLLITGTGSNPSSTAGRRLSDGGVDDDTDGAPLSRRPRASTVSDLRQQSPKPRKSFGTTRLFYPKRVVCLVSAFFFS